MFFAIISRSRRGSGNAGKTVKLLTVGILGSPSHRHSNAPLKPERGFQWVSMVFSSTNPSFVLTAKTKEKRSSRI